MDFEGRIEEKLDQLVQDLGDLRVEVKGIATKMSFIVGPDGTNGVLRILDDRVARVEKRQAVVTGAFGVIGVVVGGAAEWLGRKMFGGR